MYLTLDLTIPENFLTYCVYLVTQWHLPLPPFSSTMGYWYEIWRYTTTCNKGVPDDQFCGQGVTGLNPVTSDFSVSCCYFELNGKKTKLNIYLKYVVARGYVVSYTVFIYLKFLLATIFSPWMTLWQHSSINSTVGYSLFYGTTVWPILCWCIQVSLGCYSKNNSFNTPPPPRIYPLSKMNTIPQNQGEMVLKSVDSLNM